MRKAIFADNSRAEPTILVMEKNIIFLETFSGHFYGQFFIKTVRGHLSTRSDNIAVNDSESHLVHMTCKTRFLSARLLSLHYGLTFNKT